MDAMTESKEDALKALEVRRAENKNLARVDNANLRAGSPMYFYCPGCGAEIVVPEDYVTKPECCPECEALKKRSWLK